MRRFAILILALALITAACNRGDEAELTTTTETAPQLTTTSTSTTVATTDGGEEATTTAGAMPEYEIIAGDSGGVYVVLVEPGTYSDIDLQNIAEEIVDEYAPDLVHIVDSQDARDLVLKDEVTAEEQAVLDAHYFARVTGTMLEFLGPYSDFDDVSIGS